MRRQLTLLRYFVAAGMQVRQLVRLLLECAGCSNCSALTDFDCSSACLVLGGIFGERHFGRGGSYAMATRTTQQRSTEVSEPAQAAQQRRVKRT